MPPKESVDLVIEARWVLPIAPVNTVLTDHAVAVSAGRIVAVAPTAEVNAIFEPRERVIRGSHALLPGFVNAHTRAATALLRGLPVGGPRQQWLRETVVPTARACMSPDFVRDGTQLAIAEMLRAGITAFADMYVFPEEAARAASAARMRAAIGLPVTEGPTPWADSATGHLAKAEQLWDEYQSNPWVSLYFAPHNAFGAEDKTLARVRRVADELDARVAMYLAPGEVHENHTGGRSPLVRLAELGLLGPGFTAIHLGGVDAEELEIAASTGICVVACQQSHLRLGGPLCPAARLEALGVPVGIGTDSAVSVGAMDVLAEARLGAFLLSGGDALDRSRRGGPADDAANGSGRDGASSLGADRVGLDAAFRAGGLGVGHVGSDAALRAGGLGVGHVGSDAASRALRMATLGGATALGMNAHVGSIEVGKFADLTCIDLATLACQSASRRLADAIVFGATRDQVTDVWTSGRAAVRDGHLLTFDEQELLALARRWADRIPTGGGT
jgi:5-methylthioadenosine/S-adenosylhomocysteine deaminase